MAESQAKRDWMKKNTVQGTIKLYRKQSAEIIDYYGGRITSSDIRKALEEYIENHPKTQDADNDEDDTQEYLYGMRLRGYSPGAQPSGVIDGRDDPSGKYYDIIAYGHPLSEKECEDYELDYINPEED